MKAIRFIKASSPYNAGEVAGFPQAIADGLIATGVAELVETPELKESSPERTKELRPQKTKTAK